MSSLFSQPSTDHHHHRQVMFVLLMISVLLHLPWSSSAQCVDSSSILSCNGANMNPNRTLQPVVGFCLGCCSTQTQTTSAVLCAAGGSSLSLNISSSTTTTRCLTDGGLISCPDPTTTTNTTVISVVSAMCLRTTSCIAPCNTVIAVGRMQCIEVDEAVNASACIWMYSDEPGGAVCDAPFYVMRGACVSSVGNKNCNGHSSGAQCCPLFKVSRTSTQSISPSRTNPTQSRTRWTQSPSNTMTSLPTMSAAIIPSMSDTSTAPTVTKTRVTPTYSTKSGRRETMSLVMSHSYSGPTSSESRMTITTALTTSVLPTLTITLPSQTMMATRTLTVRQSTMPYLAVTPAIINANALASGEIQFLAQIGNARWRPETVAFIDQQMVGTQAWNAFGFDAQKEVLFRDVSLTPNASFQSLSINLRADRCLDVRGDEEIYLTVNSDYFLPINDSTVFPADTQISFVIRLAEDPTHDTRRTVGLVISILVTVLLFISGVLGNPGIALLTFCEFQLMNIVGRQSCSHGEIATYFEDSFWVVAPTMKAVGFQKYPDFGVVVVHTIFSLLFFSVFVMASRLRKRVRNYFPMFPLGVVYILFIGSTNAAWRAAVHGGTDDPGIAAGAMIIWLLYFVSVGATVMRIRSPRGLLFLRYNRGILADVLRGTHSPLQLRSKYSLNIDLWHESYVRFASPVHLLHLSVSSLVSAFSSGSTLLCFSVIGVQIAWQSIVFLLTLFTFPGRSPFHNALLIFHALMPLLVIVAATTSLDCLQTNREFQISEVLTVLSLSGFLVSSILQVIVSKVEQTYRQAVELELKDINAKHLRIVFFLDEDQYGGSSNNNNSNSPSKGPQQSAVDKLPPISRHFVTPKLVDPDWRSKRFQDMFSFPILKLVEDGDAWSGPQRTPQQKLSALATKQQGAAAAATANQSTSAAATSTWSTMAPIDRGGGVLGDDDFDDVLAQSNYSSRSVKAPAAATPGASPGNIMHSSNPQPAVAAAAESQWVSARYEGSGPSSQGGGVGLQPLASQLRFMPAMGGGVTHPSLEQQQPLTTTAMQQPFPSSSISMSTAMRTLTSNLATTPAAAIAAREGDSMMIYSPQSGTTATVTAHPRRLGATTAEPLALPSAPSTSEMVGGGETLSRCRTCNRWIILEEGCLACRLA